MRIFKRVLVVLGASWVALVAAAFVVLSMGPSAIERVMPHVPGPAFMLLPFETLWNVARHGDLQVGDPAPDFDLRTAQGSARLRLASFRDQRPVVLVFGSYT